MWIVILYTVSIHRIESAILNYAKLKILTTESKSSYTKYLWILSFSTSHASEIFSVGWFYVLHHFRVFFTAILVKLFEISEFRYFQIQQYKYRMVCSFRKIEISFCLVWRYMQDTWYFKGLIEDRGHDKSRQSLAGLYPINLQMLKLWWESAILKIYILSSMIYFSDSTIAVSNLITFKKIWKER